MVSRSIAWQHKTQEDIKYYTMALEEKGYFVSHHKSAVEFLNALSKNRYDLLVSNCMIGSGIDVDNRYPQLNAMPLSSIKDEHETAKASIRHARKIPGYISTPIVILSGCKEKEMDFLEAGASYYIDILDVSPFEFRDLVAKILSPQAPSQ
jgi:DNA-binding response OmpR family regulator